MSEEFADVRKITRTATKIENPQWRRLVEPEILRALHIDADPVSSVFEAIDAG